jgi:glycine amidinotransferase
LRRQFPELRIHLTHHYNDYTRHNDTEIVPLRPPTPGSNGLVFLNTLTPPIEENLKIWKDNDWKIIEAPTSAAPYLSPIGRAKDLSLNLLSLSENLVIIEECETHLYKVLEENGFDVITVPLRSINEYGGSIHCSTLDIKRDDECKDYFPNQDYETEKKIDYNVKFKYSEKEKKMETKIEERMQKVKMV